VRVERRTGDGDLSVRVLRWPSLSPDAKRLVFGALGHIYGQELPGGPADAPNEWYRPRVYAGLFP
jgi:hypothetical protein